MINIKFQQQVSFFRMHTSLQCTYYPHVRYRWTKNAKRPFLQIIHRCFNQPLADVSCRHVIEIICCGKQQFWRLRATSIYTQYTHGHFSSFGQTAVLVSTMNLDINQQKILTSLF